MSLTIDAAGALFATDAKVKALAQLADDRKIHRAALTGLKGSAAAVLLGRLAATGRRMIVVADDADSAGYLYHDISRVCGAREIAFFLPATSVISNTGASTLRSRYSAPKPSTGGSRAMSPPW